MSRWFWPLFAVSVVFSVLVFAALPFGPDLVFGLAAVSQLGMLVILGRACSRLLSEWDHSSRATDRGGMRPPGATHPFS